MRKQIAAANWKMNLSWQKGEALLDAIHAKEYQLTANQVVVFAVPFPYLHLAQEKLQDKQQVFVSAQNCSNKKSGAYTGEVSAEMLQSLGVPYCIIGHSERREYFNETNQQLAEKIDLLQEHDIIPVFCCGEPLQIRENNTQNAYVAKQLEESLYHLSPEQVQKVVIAYEPIWAIGTGKTASKEQAEEMHAFIREQLAHKYGQNVADSISILYGGSVKANNAKEIFAEQDVDGGLIGGASLIADEFAVIINSLKQ
jgi:triosephosphate isomerase